MRPVQTSTLALVFALVLAFAAGTASAQAPQATTEAAPVATWLRYPNTTEVQLRDVAAIVRVLPENRTDVSVSISNPGPLPMPEVRATRQKVLIEGQLRRRIRSCHAGEGGGFDVNISRHGRLSAAQLPVITLRVPQAVVLATGGAAQVHIGRAETLDLSIQGCGDADIEGIVGSADISIAGGAPNIRLYEAGEAAVQIAGGGDVTIGVVRHGLTVSIAGAGEVVAARADGLTNIAVQGAGDVSVREGHATTLTIAIVGAGDVSHNGVADRLDVAIVGAGDVHVREVTGAVTRRVIGVGEVSIGD